MKTLPEYSILNALSLGIKIQLKHELSFEDNCNLIVNSLKNRTFIIIFPFYWSHQDVVKFSTKYKNKILANDLEWYLVELNKVMNGRKQSEVHWIERVNFFHSIACTRFLNQNEVDNEKLIYLMKEVSRFDLNKPKFKNLLDISSYTFQSIKGDVNLESPVISKALQSFRKKEVLINYAKYQIFYYDGILECIKKMQNYIKNDDTNIVIPHTLLGLNWLKNLKNFPNLETTEVNDLLLDLTNQLDIKTRNLIIKLSNA